MRENVMLSQKKAAWGRNERERQSVLGPRNRDSKNDPPRNLELEVIPT